MHYYTITHYPDGTIILLKSPSWAAASEAGDGAFATRDPVQSSKDLDWLSFTEDHDTGEVTILCNNTETEQ